MSSANEDPPLTSSTARMMENNANSSTPTPQPSIPSSFNFEQYGTAHIPEDKDQLLVQTPYGRGMVIRTRKTKKKYTAKPQEGLAKNNPPKLPKNASCSADETTIVVREVELVDWDHRDDASTTEGTAATTRTQRRGPVRPATLYTTSEYPSIPPQVGDEVVCTYGRGTVLEVRRENNSNVDVVVVVVLLSSWRLAHRSRVTCYLSLEAIHVVRPKRLYEMSVVERVERAQQLKNEANDVYSARQLTHALALYQRAMDAVKYVQHRAGDDTDNETRADLVALLIVCHNNAATCGSQFLSSNSSSANSSASSEPSAPSSATFSPVSSTTTTWEDVRRHAHSALVLIEALEEKKGLKVHSVLRREGVSDVKLFGEWKVKSLVLQATALLEGRRKDYQEAADLLRQARRAIAAVRDDEALSSSSSSSLSSSSATPLSPALQSWDKTAIKLLARCRDGRQQERQKERQQALKMFATAPLGGDNGSTDEGEEKKERSTPDASPRTSPVQSNGTGTGAPPLSTPSIHPPSNGSTNNGKLRLSHLSPDQPPKKRVSFSEHVSELLYRPDHHVEAEAEVEVDAPVAVRRSQQWKREYSPTEWTGLGMPAGVLVLLSAAGTLLVCFGRLPTSPARR